MRHASPTGSSPGGNRSRPSTRTVGDPAKPSSTYAVLETTGRRSGLPRRTPVANGLQGDVFWLISAHGRHAHYVHNIGADPHVRVRVGDRWREGTAHLLSDDDARARQRELGRGRLGYRLDAVILRANATEMTTVRIDLDR